MISPFLVGMPFLFKAKEFELTFEPIGEELTPVGIKWTRELSLPIGYKDELTPVTVPGTEDMPL